MLKNLAIFFVFAILDTSWEKAISYHLIDMDSDERLLCENEYIENIAEIGSGQGSKEWWANLASEKNEHVSKLFINLCRFYSITKILSRFAGEKVCIFIVCDEVIFRQLESYCQDRFDIRTLDRFLWFEDVYERVNALSRAIFSVGKALLRKAYLKYALNLRFKGDDTKKYYIIRTWLDNRFLVEDEFRDHYFGRLPQFLYENGYDVVFLAGILGSYTKTISKIRSTRDLTILPEELFISLADLLRAIFSLSLRRTQLAQRVIFRGVDVTMIYGLEVSNGYQNANFLKNLIRYFIARRLAENIKNLSVNK